MQILLYSCSWLVGHLISFRCIFFFMSGLCFWKMKVSYIHLLIGQWNESSEHQDSALKHVVMTHFYVAYLKRRVLCFQFIDDSFQIRHEKWLILLSKNEVVVNYLKSKLQLFSNVGQLFKSNTRWMQIAHSWPPLCPFPVDNSSFLLVNPQSCRQKLYYIFLLTK